MTKIPVVLVGPVTDNVAIPSLAISLLKASLEQRGIKCLALYPSIIFLKEAGGFEIIRKLSDVIFENLLLERIFAPSAHDNIRQIDLEGIIDDTSSDSLRDICFTEGSPKKDIPLSMYFELASRCKTFLKKIARKVISHGPKVIAFSNEYQPLNAYVALAKEIKKHLPDSIYVIGGTNCDGDIGVEIANSMEIFDYVFQGEADYAFAEFCHNYFKNNILPEEKLIGCGIQHNLDVVPIPDYEDFFDQCDIPLRHIALPFESSRGCWWGQKKPCNFCGESKACNGFRFKSPKRMYHELQQLQAKYPEIPRFLAVDSIFPNIYFKKLLSDLATSDFKKQLVFSTKSNLTFSQILKMKQAGVNPLFAGVESLSTRLLTLMNKGTNALINIRFMRDCRELGVNVFWNMLVGIPGDHVSDYEEQLRLIPFIQHFNPTYLRAIRLQRFSPFVNDSKTHGITQITPIEDYYHAFPQSMDIAKLAYYFVGNYPSDSRENPEILLPLKNQMDRWRERWMKEELPELSVKYIHPNKWEVKDTRDCAKVPKKALNADEYSLLEQCRSGLSLNKLGSDGHVERLLDLGYLVEIDGKLLSIVCGSKREKTEEE